MAACLTALVGTVLRAQQLIEGTVTDEAGAPIANAKVLAPGMSDAATTDAAGAYAITPPEGTAQLTYASRGYNTLQVPIGTIGRLDVTLTRGIALDELISLGTRSIVRTELTSAAPVDVIDVAELVARTGYTDLNQLLTYASSNFTANPHVLSGANDFVDAASLRGFAPDQMLVLVNGKRRHKSAQLNLAQAFGRGTVGTDLNAIPIAAVERIEVLRDGAVAQYGSDAVAGVINVILKEATGLQVDAIAGARVSRGVPTGSDVRRLLSDNDGEVAQVGINYGARLGGAGGFLNVTALGDVREPTSRVTAFAGSAFSGFNFPNEGNDPRADITESELVRRGLTRADFNSRVGQAAIRNGSLFANLEIPVAARTTLYAFGGANYRLGETKARYSLPNAVGTVAALYPNGFLPEINGVIQDQSATAGLRQRLGKWDVDLAHAYGRNAVEYEVSNTNNASLQGTSPTVFDPGEYAFAQNTSTLDARRYFPGVLSGLQVGLGAEHRLEAFRAIAGEEPSYRDYGAASRVIGPNGDTVLVFDGVGPVATAFDELGRRRPGGVQGFDAIRPEDAGLTTRQSIGGNVDAEANLTDKLTVGLGARYEQYTDIGSALAGKLSARLLVNRDLSFRGTASTGFRAPSLHQVAYRASQPGYANGRAIRAGVFAPGESARAALGIEDLRAERSRHYSLGVGGRLFDGMLGVAVDAFQVEVNDRIVLTEPFGGTEGRRDITALLGEVGATQAAFFANAVDTRTQGFDVRLSHYGTAAGGSLTVESTLGGSYLDVRIQRVRTSLPLIGAEDTYISRSGREYVERSVPRQQIYGSVTASYRRLEVFARGVFFGFVVEAAAGDSPRQILNGRYVADLSLVYRPTAAVAITLGANNLLDAYPERLDPGTTEEGRIVYSRTTQQFGAAGRLVFLRVGLRL